MATDPSPRAHDPLVRDDDDAVCDDGSARSVDQPCCLEDDSPLRRHLLREESGGEKQGGEDGTGFHGPSVV